MELDNVSVDRDYNKINEALLTLIQSARADSKGNLQNKNVLMEGFYRDFLNILYGWKLVNANAEKQNFPGIDLIDRENHIAVQVSATCDYNKIQHSLDKFFLTNGETWHFLFVPVVLETKRLNKVFKLPPYVLFDSKKDILDYAQLLRKVQDTDKETRLLLSQFVSIEKTALWRYLNGLLRRIRDNHPSIQLMQPDKIEKRLYPNVKTPVQLEAYGKTFPESDVSPVWNVIRSSWQKPENSNIVIEGDGGIGKTITLFSVADKQEQYCPAPAVYVPMHRLVTREGNCVNLSDFCRSLSDSFGNKINELAEKDWDDGPQLLILLDGFNEVPAAKQRIILHMLNDWHLSHPGAQYIAVSRPMDMVNLRKELVGNTISVTLEPITKMVARDYLRDRNATLPPDGADIWKTLVYPIFLTLYIKTDGLMGRTVDGYHLAPKETKNGGTLVWNYLQRELLREESEAWVLRCAVACEFILPYIAYQMVKNNTYTLKQKEAKNYVIEALKDLDFSSLPQHLTDVFETYRELNDLENPDFSTIKWYTVVVKETGVLVHREEHGTLSFMHQIFRDCLAGIYLVNQTEMNNNDDLPEVWRHAQNHLVLDYTADLMDAKTADNLWEINRQKQQYNQPGYVKNHTATYTLLELQKRRQPLPETLNFSGMDLSKLSLARYMKQFGKVRMYEHETGREGTDLGLFRNVNLTKDTRLNRMTFQNEGHHSRVSCVSILSDRYVVSGSWDYTLRIWDSATGQCLQTLEGHKNRVSCVAVLPDAIVVSGSDDCTLRIWDTTTGKCLHTLEGHKNRVSCMAVLPGGVVVSGSDDYTLRIWDAATGQCLQTLEGHQSRISCMAVLADEILVSGSDDNTLRIWDAATGQCLHILIGHQRRVSCVTILPNEMVVSGSDDRTLKVWDAITGQCLQTLNGHMSCVSCVAALSDRIVVSGSNDSTLRVWDAIEGRYLQTLEGHKDYINCLEVFPDGRVVSGSRDNSLRVWDVIAGRCLQTLKGHKNSVYCVSILPNGTVVSGSRDNSLRVWDVAIGNCLQSLVGYQSRIYCMTVFPDGRLVCGSWDNTLRVWDISSSQCVQTIEGHKGSVYCLTIISEKNCLISGSLDNTLRIWDTVTGKYLQILKGHKSSVYCVAVLSHNSIVSGSWDKTLKVWDVSTGQCLKNLEGHADEIDCVATLPNGRVISGSKDKTLRVWDTITGRCLLILEGHTGSVSCVAVLSHSSIVSGSWDRTLRIWNVSTGQCLRILEGHTDEINCIALLPNGHVISGSDDTTLRVWDISTGQCLKILNGHTGDVNCVAVLPNGHVISGSSDATLRVWDLNISKCIEVLEATEVDVSLMDVSQSILTESLEKLLWRNGAKTSMRTINSSNISL